MAVENANEFMGLIRTDEELQAKLTEAGKAFAGDNGDEKGLFEAVVAPLAAEVGLPFTFEEYNEVAASREIDEADLDAIAGGSKCYGVGF